MTERHALLQPRIALPFALVTLIWGSTWLVIKDQIGLAPASWSVAWRFAIATLGMGALALARGDGLRIGRAGVAIALAMAVCQFSLNFNMVYRAEYHLTSGVVAVFFGLLMVPNALFGRVFLGVPITRGFVIGSLIGIAGIALMMLHEARVAPAGGNVGLGILFAAGGLFAASAANILQATQAARRQPMTSLLFWAMAFGTLVDVGLALASEGAPVLPPSPRYWMGVAYLGIVGSVVTFPLYFMLIRELGPGRAAYNGVAVPVVAMLLSTLFEDYRWTLLAAAGGALGLAGMAVALHSRSPVTPRPE